MTPPRKPDAPTCTAEGCGRWLIARGLCPQHHTAVEQAIAFLRSDDWICERHGVTVAAIEAVSEHLDAVNEDPEAKAERRRLLRDLEREVLIVAENAALYRHRNRPFPKSSGSESSREEAA